MIGLRDDDGVTEQQPKPSGWRTSICLKKNGHWHSADQFLTSWMAEPGKKNNCTNYHKIFLHFLARKVGWTLFFFQIQWHVLLRKIPDCRVFCGTFLCWVCKPGDAHIGRNFGLAIGKVSIREGTTGPNPKETTDLLFLDFAKSAKKQIQVKSRFFVLFF